MDLSNCCCCSWDTWRNEVYYDLKGGESRRHLNELRVQHALSFLTPEEIELAAYDAGGAEVKAGFTEGVVRAARNFNAIYPMSRWKELEDHRETGECGPYDSWSTVRLNDEQNVAKSLAIQDATRLSAQAAFTSWFGESDWECSSLVPSSKCSSTGAYRQRSIVNRIPSSDPKRFVLERPSRKEIYEIANGQVGPSPWLKEFLDVFASGWDSLGTGVAASLLGRKVAAQRMTAVAATRVALQAKTIQSAAAVDEVEKQHADAPAPSEKRPARNIVPDAKVGAYVAVAGAALLLGGAVFLHVRRGRRAGGRR